MVTTGMLRRAEFRKQLKIQQQLKGITLALVAVLLLAAYPIYLFTQAVTADPVYNDLNSLSLPDWAKYDQADAPPKGSRWCIGECSSRSRTYASERQPEETHEAFKAALFAGDWRRRAEPGCPVVNGGSASNDGTTVDPSAGTDQSGTDQSGGDGATDGTGSGVSGPVDGQVEDGTFRSCWVKDEYVLVLRVYVPICDVQPPRDTSTAGTQSAPAHPLCPGSYATLQVFNAVDYQPAAPPASSGPTDVAPSASTT